MHSPLSPIIAIFILLILSSCSVATIKSHNPHYKSSREIAKIKGMYKIENVSGGNKDLETLLERKDLQCRGTTFDMPPKMSVRTYIADALTNELDAAGKLDNTTGRAIRSSYNRIEPDTSNFDNGFWYIEAMYEIGGNKYNVKTITEFSSAFNASVACVTTANMFEDAIAQNFLEFFKLLNAKK